MLCFSMGFRGEMDDDPETEFKNFWPRMNTDETRIVGVRHGGRQRGCVDFQRGSPPALAVPKQGYPCPSVFIRGFFRSFLWDACGMNRRFLPDP